MQAVRSRSREDLFDAVRASPDAVARHDKQGWLDSFSEHAIVEDPVGTAGAHGRADLARFYDTFIAPNDVSFEVAQDIVVGETVLRDVVIQIRSSFGIEMRVPAYLLYELVEEDGHLKIARLAAHWELARMTPQAMRRGLAGLRMMTAQSIRMLRIQGWRGMRGYMRGFSGVGARGKEAVRRFADAARDRDHAVIAGLLAPACRGLEFPAGAEPLDAASFVVAAGGELSVANPLSSGFTASFRFQAQKGGALHKGIGLFEFEPGSCRIRRARFFWDD